MDVIVKVDGWKFGWMGESMGRATAAFIRNTGLDI
jgi:hypothetical protein